MDINLYDVSALEFMLEVQKKFDEDITIDSPFITVSFYDGMGQERTFKVTQERPDKLH